MPRRVLLSLALLAVGCGTRPSALQRDEKLDTECSTGTRAFVYSLDAKDPGLVDRAVSAGCHAPIGAWTGEEDQTRGGIRKLAYDLRASRKTLLCCY